MSRNAGLGLSEKTFPKSASVTSFRRRSAPVHSAPADHSSRAVIGELIAKAARHGWTSLTVEEKVTIFYHPGQSVSFADRISALE